MARQIYDYVIFHRGCTDGFAGFFILTTTNQIDKHALIYPDMPSAKDVPPNIDGKNIIVIDVAYKKDILLELFHRCNSVTFIDHHISIRDDVLEMIKTKKNDNIIIVYDERKSGASLTWNYFYPKRKMPLFIKYIEDNDTGAWKLRNTLPFINALDVKYDLNISHKNLKKWKKLFNEKVVEELVKIGITYDEYKEYLLEINLKRYSLESFPSEKIYTDYPEVFSKVGQYKVVVYNGSGCPNASILGSRFMNKINCDFVIIWVYHTDRKEYVLSMRSKIVDISNIAKAFGGGGHKLAAACAIPVSKYHIEDLFMSESLPRGK